MQFHLTKWEAQRMADILRTRRVPDSQYDWADDAANRLESSILKIKAWQRMKKNAVETGKVSDIEIHNATEEQLRELYRIVDYMPDGADKQELVGRLDKECSRRAGDYNDRIAGGEWI